MSKPSVRLKGLRKLVARLGGAELCYGDAVHVGDRAVVPVARVQAFGGGGGGVQDKSGTGGGGGGGLNAKPVGFIDIGPEGARFEAIPDPDRTAKLVTAGAVAVAVLVTASAVRRRLLR